MYVKAPDPEFLNVRSLPLLFLVRKVTDLSKLYFKLWQSSSYADPHHGPTECAELEVALLLV